MVDDLLYSENLGDAEVLHLDDVLPFGVEEYGSEFEVCVRDASLVAVAQQGEQLPDDRGCSILLKVLLIFEDSGKGLSVAILNDHEKSMVVLEQLIYLRDCGVIYLLESADLLLKQLPFVTADLVLIDNINRPHKRGLDMYNLPQLIKLVLFKTGRQYLILLLNTPLYLLNEVILFELYFFPIQDLNGRFIYTIFLHLIAHLRSMIIMVSTPV